MESDARLPEAFEKASAEEGSSVAVAIGVALANPGLIRAGLEADIEVATWTVDEPSEAAAGMEIGIRRFTTNEVEKLLAWRDSLS